MTRKLDIGAVIDDCRTALELLDELLKEDLLSDDWDYILINIRRDLALVVGDSRHFSPAVEDLVREFGEATTNGH